MIDYRFPEEREYVRFIADKMGRSSIVDLLEGTGHPSKSDARAIFEFYWDMVDFSIELEKKEDLPWAENAEFWSEKISHSIISYLKRSGHEDVLKEMLSSMK